MNCKGCGRFFRPNSGRQMYCSMSCRRKHYARLAAEKDKKEEEPSPWNRRRQSTGHEIDRIVRDNPGDYAKQQAAELRKRMWDV